MKERKQQVHRHGFFMLFKLLNGVIRNKSLAGLAEVLDSLQVTSMHPGKDFHFDNNTEGHIRQRQAQSEINELEAARGHDNRERERNEGTG